MDEVTLNEALELFRLPRTLGILDGEEVTVGAGRFGAYVLYKKQYTSIPKEEDPLTITLQTAIGLINDKKQQEQQRHIKTLEGDKTIEVLNGRYGPYLVCDGQNYRLPKAMHANVAEVTYEECCKIIDEAPVKTAKSGRGRK